MNKREQKDFIKQATLQCEAAGLRVTEPRLLVLEIIAAQEKPLGAHDILDALAQKMDKPKPPTAYRALEFWVEQGFIHRIESLNAFVPCQTDHRHEGSQFMICDRCGTVIETHLCDLPKPLADKTKAAHFEMTRWNVELHGTCEKCH
jgi:Fur family zinc uptake transcriptional regulator